MSIIDDLQLIEEVKKYPLLYNNRYRNCDTAKEKAWVDISVKLNAKPNEVRSRWRNLRDKFVREKKVMLSTGSPSVKDGQIQHEWPLMENMSFIWQHIVHRKKRRSRKSTVKSEYMDQSEELPENTEWLVALECDSRNGQNHISQNETESESPAKKKAKRIVEYEESPIQEVTDFIPVSEGEENYSQRMDQTESFIADDNHYFCMAVAETMRRFPSRQKAEAKLKIQQLLFDIEFNSNSSKNDVYEEI